ncbi:hypothetical protein ESCOCP327M_23645 [Escherichia coli]
MLIIFCFLSIVLFIVSTILLLIFTLFITCSFFLLSFSFIGIFPFKANCCDTAFAAIFSVMLTFFGDFTEVPSTLLESLYNS